MFSSRLSTQRGISVARKTPVRHMVKTHVRKRKDGLSYAQVRTHARGSGAKVKAFKGTPAYLSNRPTPSEVIRGGYGVGARVELIAKQTTRGGQEMDPKFAHPIGATGVIIGHFGADPTVKWDEDAYTTDKSGQVVEAKKLRIIGKLSSKKEIIASGNYEKIRKFAADYAYGFHEDGNKITVTKSDIVMDDAGFIVGDVEYQLIGRKHGDHIDFDTPKLVLASVPRSQRWSQRDYFESQDPKDLFGGMFE